MGALRCRDRGAVEQRLMQPDRAIDFAASAEQAAQGDLGFDGIGVRVLDFEEGLDGGVGLLVEQQREPAEVALRQAGDALFGALLASALAGEKAAQRCSCQTATTKSSSTRRPLNMPNSSARPMISASASR
jgi:hypothetical protein